jgi:hypothetical protein
MSAAPRSINTPDELRAVPFPERTDVRWETTNIQVWNTREGSSEQQELVYEVSWIKELGMWRRFLTSRRTVRSAS